MTTHVSLTVDAVVDPQAFASWHPDGTLSVCVQPGDVYVWLRGTPDELFRFVVDLDSAIGAAVRERPEVTG